MLRLSNGGMRKIDERKKKYAYLGSLNFIAGIADCECSLGIKA
jgi:hypothetical protein